MDSGYWFVLCLDIQEVWDMCRPESKTSKPNMPEYICEAVEFEETEEERAERCHDVM